MIKKRTEHLTCSPEQNAATHVRPFDVSSASHLAFSLTNLLPHRLLGTPPLCVHYLIWANVKSLAWPWSLHWHVLTQGASNHKRKKTRHRWKSKAPAVPAVATRPLPPQHPRQCEVQSASSASKSCLGSWAERSRTELPQRITNLESPNWSRPRVKTRRTLAGRTDLRIHMAT